MRVSIVAFAVALLSTIVYARSKVHTPEFNPIDTREYLVRFHEDPRRTMNTPLAKWDEMGRIVPKEFSAFGPNSMFSDEILNARSSIRDKICASSEGACEKELSLNSFGSFGTYAAFDDGNQAASFFVDSTYLKVLKDMETKGLMRGKVLRAPWSDSFWPTHRGMIARRWLDREFPESRTFIDNYTYYEANPPSKKKTSDTFSPAEKYDLLVGDSSFGLTAWNWNQGKSTWDAKGAVPNWEGICHGWAAASIIAPAPKRAVTLPGRDGASITFYPSDIKALTSALWANASAKKYVVGSRCNTPRPEEDEMGRVIDPDCFDVNPGTWHIAVVNQIGVKKESFIIDAQYDYQIWNYPLHSYKYSYFNPQTLETSESMGGSAVRIENFTIDKFKRYRSPETKYVVGIAMEVSYSIETAPSTRPFQRPLLHAVKLLYDLELDAAGKIVGGEWYSNFHPDFIWHFDQKEPPISIAEKEMGLIKWDGKSPLPKKLREAVREASSHGQPLGAVIDAIVRLSQEAE